MWDATSAASIVTAPDACARRWTLLVKKDASRYFDSKDISVRGKSPTKTVSMCFYFGYISRMLCSIQGGAEVGQHRLNRNGQTARRDTCARSSSATGARRSKNRTS